MINNGSRFDEADIPSDMIELPENGEIPDRRNATYDENLLEKFISDEDISEDEFMSV